MNAATNFAPETALPLMVSFMAVAFLAVVIAVATRGRLGYDRHSGGDPARLDRRGGRG